MNEFLKHELKFANRCRFRNKISAYRNENSVTIFLEIPGIKKENITIQIENAKVYVTSKNDDNSLISLEPINEVFTLSDIYNLDKINANFKNGILEITVDKKDDIKPRTVTIN